ncbi:MAG: hypothetical protein ACYC5V_05555 [Gemmatimonadaceae bacterium]
MKRQWLDPHRSILLAITVVSMVGCGPATTESPVLPATLSLSYPGGEKNFGVTVGLSVTLVVEARDETGRLLTDVPVTFTSRSPTSLEVTPSGVLYVRATPGGYVVAEALGRAGVLRDSIKASVIEILDPR